MVSSAVQGERGVPNDRMTKIMGANVNNLYFIQRAMDRDTSRT